MAKHGTMTPEQQAAFSELTANAQQLTLDDIQKAHEARYYGYARISTPKQKLKRQVENIKAKYPEAVT